jgi:hypothetical protein
MKNGQQWEKSPRRNKNPGGKSPARDTESWPMCLFRGPKLCCRSEGRSEGKSKNLSAGKAMNSRGKLCLRQDLLQQRKPTKMPPRPENKQKPSSDYTYEQTKISDPEKAPTNCKIKIFIEIQMRLQLIHLVYRSTSLI